MSLLVFYGGTFDPVHSGHLRIARCARDRLDAVIRLMPAPDPPHRPTPGASAQHRARMLDLAVAGERGLRVDRREFDRATPSYTAETLRRVREEVGAAAPVALLVGADSFVDLPHWKDWSALLDLAHLVVAERAGFPLGSGLPAALSARVDGRWAADANALRQTAAGRVLPLGQPLHPEAATDVRRLIVEGRPWRQLVPVAVAEYIDRHLLYVRAAAGPGPA